MIEFRIQDIRIERVGNDPLIFLILIYLMQIIFIYRVSFMHLSLV